MKVREFLFTGFYSGYSPVAPGTAGTLVATALYILENMVFYNINPLWLHVFNLSLVLILIYPSIKLGDDAEEFFGRKDPGEVVLDEILGYWVGILFIPFSFTNAILAFIFFRLFDIIKPYPANGLQSLDGGLGIMIDDIVAGIYTLAVMHATVFIFYYFGIVLP